MSTSPNTQKGANMPGQPTGSARSPQSESKPAWILLKGIFWLALVVGIIVALGINYEIVWDFFVEFVFPGMGNLWELADGALDGFFALVGLGGFASIATVYTEIVLGLAILYLLSRWAIGAYRKTKAKKQEITQMYASAWHEWYGSVRETAGERITNWWNSLDLMNKVVAAVFLVLIGIPVALLLSFILGSLVASLL